MKAMDVLFNRISQPPTNSPLTYSCGIVGQSLTEGLSAGHGHDGANETRTRTP